MNDQKPFFNNVARLPIRVIKAEGIELYDAESERWLMDFWSDEATQPFGYGTRMSNIIADFAATKVAHQMPDIYPHRERTKCAEYLTRLYGYDRIFFSNSGAEANEFAIKIARKWAWLQGKDAAICYTLPANFHGRTYGALGLSDSEGAGSPYHKREYDWDDPSATKWAGFGVAIPELAWMKRRIIPRNTAAIFMAPILGNNCVAGYPVETLQMIRDFCDYNDILLVYDEVQTGSGWTGKYSASEYFGVKPDIMTLGKRMALGFPMSATLANDSVANVITEGTHFNTFAGSPMMCYMANLYHDWLEHYGLEEIAEKGQFIRERLESIDGIINVQQYGMMISFLPDFTAVPSSFELCKRAFEKGLLIVSHREHGEIRFTPPLIVSKGDIVRATNILRECLS